MTYLADIVFMRTVKLGVGLDPLFDKFNVETNCFTYVTISLNQEGMRLISLNAINRVA